MNIVLAVKGVWVFFSVFNAFHLDCGMEQLVLPTAKVSGLAKRLQWFLACDVN